jgi:hypothetical protein
MYPRIPCGKIPLWHLEKYLLISVLDAATLANIPYMSTNALATKMSASNAETDSNCMQSPSRPAQVVSTLETVKSVGSSPALLAPARMRRQGGSRS